MRGVRRVVASIAIVAAGVGLIAIAAANTGLPECHGDQHAWAGFFVLLGLLAYAVIGSAVAAAVIGASTDIGHGLAACAVLVLSVAAAMVGGFALGTLLDGCEVVADDADDLLVLACGAALVGAVPGYIVGLVAAAIGRRIGAQGRGGDHT